MSNEQNSTFIPAPAGLTARFPDGGSYPIVAFEVVGKVLIPHYLSGTGNCGELASGKAWVTADWIDDPS
ncbi:MAG: hypothetical protein KDB70_05035 [Mycobacterium sp.]|nr:hypothetical protein [Mycobacterium sp.]